MIPNATVNGVPGISLRDEPWAEAENAIRQAWDAGFRGMHFDDGLLMFRDTAQNTRKLIRSKDAQTYTGLSDIELALRTAKEIWWLTD